MSKPIDGRDIRVEPEFRDQIIEDRVNYYTRLGFGTQFIRGLLEQHPSFLKEGRVDRAITVLTSLGFQDPIKMITTLPAILGYGEENIKGKIKFLNDLGFQDPIKMITASPVILGLAEENIKGKIKFLNDLGFQDPIKMITTLPAILGYGEENITFRVDLFRRAITLYSVPLSSISLMEKVLSLWSTKKEKLFVLMRIIREYKLDSDHATPSLINQMIMCNLEDLLIALHETPAQDRTSLQNLIKKAKEVKARDLSKEQKRKLIAGDLDTLSKDLMIASTYKRGYLK